MITRITIGAPKTSVVPYYRTPADRKMKVDQPLRVRHYLQVEHCAFPLWQTLNVHGTVRQLRQQILQLEELIQVNREYLRNIQRIQQVAEEVYFAYTLHRLR
jgi:hypothetical protein